MGTKKIEVNSHGINSVSWGPPFYPISFEDESSNENLAPMRFVVGGCDNLVKFYTASESSANEFKLQPTNKFTFEIGEGHGDWVRDVAWLNHIGLPYDLVASCGEDNLVYLWTKKKEDKEWCKTELKNFNVPVWRVSWSFCGSCLAVSTGNNTVYLFKENIDGKWEMLSSMNPEGKMEQINN